MQDSSLNAAAMLELGHTLQRLVAPNDPVPLSQVGVFRWAMTSWPWLFAVYRGFYYPVI